MGDYWHISGENMIRDPGLLRLRRYLPVLALISAPYAGAGNSDPVNPLDPVQEWRALARILDAQPVQREGTRVALALARLVPPTLARLREVLARGEHDPDAFRVAHIIAQGEHDTLLLEHASGGTQIVGAEAFAGAFATSGVRVVVLDGCFSPLLAELLVERTPVQAVVGTRRKLAQPSASAFNAAFYTALCTGQPVREAFRMAVGVLERTPGGGADRYEVVLADDVVTVPLPHPDERAGRALLLDGQPRRVSVPGPPPDVTGFIGRRDALARLAEALPDAGTVIALYGPAGVGKTWLAAQVVERFAWRFPDGVLWLRCDATTTDHTIFAHIERLLNPCGVPPARIGERGTVLDDLQGRRVLVVLDDLDVVTPDDERARIVHAMRTLCEQSDSRAIITAREFQGALVALVDDVVLPVERFDPKAARTLAMRLAVERGLDVLDVDTIDDFLERTQGLPWLVAAGVRWIEAHRFKAALDSLAAFPSDAADPLAAHVAAQVQAIGAEGGAGLRLLRRAARLPEAFDARLALGLGGDDAEAQIAALVGRGLLLQEGDMYRLPPLVRAQVNAQMPLNATHRAQVDRVIMLYLTRTWPPALQEPELLPEPGAFTRADWARLANARALLREPSEGEMQVEPVVVAQLLIAAAPMLRAAGLAEECARYARATLDRLPQGASADRVRVQIVLGMCEREADAVPLFERLMALPGLDPALAAEAGHNYGRVLLAAEKFTAAAEALEHAFAVLHDHPEPDLARVAAVRHDWARALVAAGREAGAIAQYREALSAYARLERPRPAAAALHELGAVLVRHVDAAEQPLETLERAEDLLQRALVSADQDDDHGLAARIRIDLAELHKQYARALAGREAGADRRAEWDAAAGLLLAARRGCAVYGAVPEQWARVLALSASIDAQRAALRDAGADALRSAVAYAAAGDAREQARSLVLAGRLLMAHGDSVAAQAALHDALDVAAQADAGDVLAEAAAVLVRVHQIRARRVPVADADFAAYTREQAQESRGRLRALALDEHAGALDSLLAALG